MKRASRQQGKAAFDIIEESTHLLRTAPAATLAAYYLGSIPSVLGLLYFWADMSRSPFADQHLAGASLAAGLLFLWMKFWQAIFASHLRAQIAVEPVPRLNWRLCARIVLAQTISQPFGLFLIPLSLLPVIPFARIYGFFQNITALAGGHEGSAANLLKKSWRQAALWPRQIHFTLAIMAAFAFYVFVNWATVCLMLPGLFKMLFGVESSFSKSPDAMLNTTFFAGMFGLTYLCVDPVLKTIFALRCFYGESLQSGEDLKAELKTFVPAPQKIAIGLLLLSVLALVSPARAENTTAPAPPVANQKISPADLDHLIARTIHEEKYAWRMPRGEISQDAPAGVLVGFFDQAGAMLRKWARAALDELDTLMRKFFHHPPVSADSPGVSGYGWIMSVEILLYGLAAAVIAALVIFLYRVWQNRQKSAPVLAEPILSVPDLADENVRADQLPEDAWTRLARELLERGEFRLAMRAFYLASLSHLAAQNLISIARFKSNRDYERELHRRAHSLPHLLSVFGDNVFDFERIWYGRHEINLERVHQFAANVEKIKSAG